MAFGTTMWLDEGQETPADSHVGFFTRFRLNEKSAVQLRLLSPGTCLVYLDGELVLEGPLRYAPNAIEFLVLPILLDAGEHTLAIHALHDGLVTRIMPTEHPLLGCHLSVDGNDLPLAWTALRLEAYSSKVRRINPQLGWIDWVNTSSLPTDWLTEGFGTVGKAVVVGAALAGEPTCIRPPLSTLLECHQIAEGKLTNAYGYERDDISARFYLRDLDPKDIPAQGVWHRYDLGQVRLGRPLIDLEVPAGSVIQMAMSETLSSGRVTPWITLSAGDSCNLDHFIAHGGRQTFMPTSPKGGRFLEVHILADPSAVKVHKAQFRERHYYGEPVGAFKSGNRQLDEIWKIGVDTQRACSEDTLIDNPTRERGQWLGDIASVGLEIAAVAHNDLGILRRGLKHTAACARDDGMVAGLCPGGGAYLSTYAAQWFSAVISYWRHSGDRAILDELYPAALRNAEAFLKVLTPDGLNDSLGWGFIDWGYVRNEGPTDMGVNLHFLPGLRDLVLWCKAIGREDDANRFFDASIKVQCLVRLWLDETLAHGSWTTVGFHRAVLSLRAGLLSASEATECVKFVKAHYLDCFPNRQDAPRLSDPDANNSGLITPYFSHFALAELWERGEGDFALDQYQKCWGWAMSGDRTTWVEVFDPRWSHCHSWSGCPTWQLSRYALGIRARLDLGPDTYEFAPVPSRLRGLRGTLPLSRSGNLEVQRDGADATITSSRPITVHHKRGVFEGKTVIHIAID